MGLGGLTIAREGKLHKREISAAYGPDYDWRARQAATIWRMVSSRDWVMSQLG